MERVWITSDLHFYHDNIISHCNRPTTIEEHNSWLINTLNASIKEGDTVYHCGDFGFGKNATFENLKNILSQLNGNWLFVVGNHDKENQLKEICKEAKGKHQVLGHYYERRFQGKDIIMFHYPIESWNKQRYGSIHFHGHLHNNKTRIDIKNRFNICFDVDYRPYLLSEFIGE